jgi:hypothetical protein
MKTLSLNILDIVQNSIRAKATEISIMINESKSEDLFMIKIQDNGLGIKGELLSNITDPFVTTRTKRNIGMGLSLLKYHANLTGGDLNITSEENKGTTLIATFSHSHFDRQPLGDIAGVVTLLIAGNPGIEFNYIHKTDEGEYSFSTIETKKFLETGLYNDYQLLNMIGTMISGNLKDICVSDINT